MGFIGTAKMNTNALSQLGGGKQAIGFHNSLLGMHPPGFDRIEPGTFGGQKEWQDTHPFALLLDLTIVLSDPGLNDLAVMPGGVIPDQQPGCLALCLQPGTDPLAAHWVVMALTGRPSTKRSDIFLRIGSVTGPCCQSTP